MNTDASKQISSLCKETGGGVGGGGVVNTGASKYKMSTLC